MTLSTLFELSPLLASYTASLVCIYIMIRVIGLISREAWIEKSVAAARAWLVKELTPVKKPSRRSELFFRPFSAVMFYLLSISVFLSANGVLLTAYLHSDDKGVFPLLMLCLGYFAFSIVVARLLLVNGNREWDMFRSVLNNRKP